MSGFGTTHDVSPPILSLSSRLHDVKPGKNLWQPVLRATFITLAMEHEATLEQTQYAARHKDPRTTERYRKRKLNLDNNAVDKLSFLAREDDSAGIAGWDAWEKALKD